MKWSLSDDLLFLSRVLTTPWVTSTPSLTFGGCLPTPGSEGSGWSQSSTHPATRSHGGKVRLITTLTLGDIIAEPVQPEFTLSKVVVLDVIIVVFVHIVLLYTLFFTAESLCSPPPYLYVNCVHKKYYNLVLYTIAILFIIIFVH